MAQVLSPTITEAVAPPTLILTTSNTKAQPTSDSDRISTGVSSPHTATQQRPSGRQTMVRRPTSPDVRLPGATPRDQGPNFVIAVDFGTTYSTVAFAKGAAGKDMKLLGVEDIHCIDNYRKIPGGGSATVKSRYENVPTDILYLAKTTVSSDDESASDLEPGTDLLNPMPPPLGAKINRKRNRPDRQPRASSQAFIKWGYGAYKFQQQLGSIDERAGSEVVKLIKVHLDEDSLHTQDLRAELEQQVKRLQSHGFVSDRDHIISDYLARLLLHSKSVLIKKEGLRPEAKISYVLCVPVSWTVAAGRVMHNAMAEAIRRSGLGRLQGEAIEDLFMVSEPEAAAQYVVASEKTGRLRKGEVFVLLDAGGGTVDVTTYQVTSDTGPLRLKGEVIKAEGASCGSSFINKAYAKALMEKLEGENFFGGGSQLKSFVDGLVNNWESNGKPDINVEDRKSMIHSIYIPGLKKNRVKGFPKDNYLRWTDEEIGHMFEPSLKGTEDLLERQLDQAVEKRITVSKVIVVGGFGESPSLQNRLTNLVGSKTNLAGGEIDILWPDKVSTSAVARGAVLRSLNKDNGPTRQSLASFGFLRTEQYDPNGPLPEYIEAKVVPRVDPIDGWQNVKDTIYWVIQAGPELPTIYESETIRSCHTFPPSQTALVCVEYLYSSPRNQRSHFQLRHPENAAAKCVGFIEIDMTEFASTIAPESNAYEHTRARKAKRENKNVVFDLVIIVEGRQLKYEARWPSNAISPDEVKVRRTGYVSLAPSLAPGTA